MNENRKLAEAQYLLSHLRSCAFDQNTFEFELSAFLSAARSVLQYACKEAITKAGGQAWYDAHMTATPEIKYFRDKRNANIHVKPVVPNPHIMVSVSTHTSLSLTARDPDGNVIEERNVSSSVAQSAPASVSYHFSDWSGSDDVETLCYRYFLILETIVKDGQAKGFLSKP